MRIFIGTLATETNTFSPIPTGNEAFREREFFAKQSEMFTMIVSVLGTFITSIMAVGALFGALYAGILQAWLPLPGLDPTAFAIVGMAAFFVGVVRAPFTGIALVVELTATTTLLVPMLLAGFGAMLAATLLGGEPIYDTLRERMLRKMAPVDPARARSVRPHPGPCTRENQGHGEPRQVGPVIIVTEADRWDRVSADRSGRHQGGNEGALVAGVGDISEPDAVVVATVAELRGDVSTCDPPLRNDGLRRVTKLVGIPLGAVAMPRYVALRAVIEVIDHAAFVDGKPRGVCREQPGVVAHVKFGLEVSDWWASVDVTELRVCVDHLRSNGHLERVAQVWDRVSVRSLLPDQLSGHRDGWPREVRRLR